LLLENEKLKFELNQVKTELRDTIKQHQKRKSTIEELEKERD